jgi:SAM-dependent methyltransferase
MIETICHEGIDYPKFQSQGFAAKFCIPFALEVCKGLGVDIGPNRKEWSFPGSIMVDPVLESNLNALNFPYENLDYVFSSHCLEHLDNWVDVLDYWYDKLKNNGVLFLYLPDYSQTYHRPWTNRKHKNIFSPTIIKDYMIHKKYSKVFVSGVDLHNSFIAMGEK